MAERRPPLDAAVDAVLDVVLYAPIGLAVEAQRLLPALAREGRTRVDQRVTLARFVGRLAVRTGRDAVEKRLAGLRPTSVDSTAAPVVPDVIDTDVIDTEVEAPSASEPIGVASDAPQATDLPLAGYDSLSASQVVSRLAALSVDELGAVADYERAHRRRRTILGKIDQLLDRVA